MNRRSFLARTGAVLAAPSVEAGSSLASEIDHRFSPLSGQTAFCFPDDPFKSLVGDRGDLRYGFERGRSLDYFPLAIGFSLAGMEPDTVIRQELESPSTPIVHTWLGRPEALLHLTAFATNETGEGRVDNVLLEVSPRVQHSLHARVVITIRTTRKFAAKQDGGRTILSPDGRPETPVLLASAAGRSYPESSGYRLDFPPALASTDQPLRILLRFPQENQTTEKLFAGLAAPQRLLDSARDYWQRWQPWPEKLQWQLPTPYQNFLVACARNIQQAREMRNGQLTFQVGPTVYRGLWVVDGNFILEAARYLGYDGEAQKGLETTWSYQDASGGVFAGAGREHYKDAGIAMFTLARQAELAQDWTYFRSMREPVEKGAAFLAGLREKARAEGSSNGRYGLLARGMGDGGIGGVRPELTNTVWVLAGLKAILDTTERQKLTGFDTVRRLHSELRPAFFEAAKQEMRHHPAGFDFLPMLMKEDPLWQAPDPWDRPRPQSGQWALSHSIYPGLVFPKDHPVVQGHIRLMQAVTQEDIPAETGWISHEGLWGYNAPFVSHVYLWAGVTDWARHCFQGFLNHATPLFCWREEQPIRGSVSAGYVGDMPHNWASAECILYLRHMLALEDGPELRLLSGIGDTELQPGQPFVIQNSPSRFGRISLRLEPLPRRTGWRLEFRRENGPAPQRLTIPSSAGYRYQLAAVEGASHRLEAGVVQIEPAATAWTATLKA